MLKARPPLRRREASPTRQPQHEDNPYRLYRTGRLAELFDVDRITIWRWRKQGVLPEFTRVGSIEGLTEEQLKMVVR